MFEGSISYKFCYKAKKTSTNIQTKTPWRKAPRGKKDGTSYFSYPSQKSWISFFLFILYPLGYPSG